MSRYPGTWQKDEDTLGWRHMSVKTSDIADYFQQIFQDNNKDNIKVSQYWPFDGNPLVTDGV